MSGQGGPEPSPSGWRKFRRAALLDQAARGPWGGLLASAMIWADPPTIWAMTEWYFPASRLWAAAELVRGDARALAREAGAGLPGGLWLATASRILKSYCETLEAAREADADWHEAMWSAHPPPDKELLELESARRWRHTAHSSMRAAFLALLAGGEVPALKWAIPSPDEMMRLRGPALREPEKAFAPLPETGIEIAHGLPKEGLTEYWLRFEGANGNRAYARVTEPDTARALPTLIMGNGVCVEWDRLVRGVGMGRLLADRGFRAIEIVSPGHGLRAWAGWYAGEWLFAAGPLGTLDILATQACEVGMLVAWARKRYGGPVAVGGVSMGALAAEHVLSRCAAWPEENRPDGGLLVGHTGRIDRAGQSGALARRFGMEEALKHAGWSKDDLKIWLPVVNPRPATCVPPGNIVSVLGKRDELLPFSDGQATVESWRLPEENRFTLPQGHFGLPLGILRDPRPFERLHHGLG
ncbi:MAG: hypothetical protein ACLFWF_04850 [Alphaproteobacteria bacterium]